MANPKFEDDIEPDLVQEAFQQAWRREAIANMRFLINTAWLAIVSTPILLALILWRVW